MAWAVDTASELSAIDWSAVYSWKGVYPQWAGRYFSGAFTWSAGETKAKAQTNGVLVKIAPISYPNSAGQETTGAAGHSAGISDANTTCGNITSAIDGGQLSLPSGGFVVVWLDVEQRVNLTPAYWAGWATTVNGYRAVGGAPFLPGIYTGYTNDTATGVWYPQSSVQSCLNTVCKYWPDDDYFCKGLWANEPEPCTYATDPTAVPDWSVLGNFTQTGCGNTPSPVPLYLYQYMERTKATAAVPSGCGVSNFAGGQNLDLDSSDDRGGESYMLTIE